MGRRIKTGQFIVARSHLYYEGIYVVEVEVHGLDNLSPGVLVQRYDGELKEFDDPRAAVEAAIRIRDAWIADGEEVAGITFGTTHGGLCEPEVFDGTDDELRAKATELWKSLPKCDKCGELRSETYHISDMPEQGDFCSENCAETALDEYNQVTCQKCGNEVPEGRQYYCSDHCYNKGHDLECDDDCEDCPH